jgi:hypothetical protein
MVGCFCCMYVGVAVSRSVCVGLVFGCPLLSLAITVKEGSASTGTYIITGTYHWYTCLSVVQRRDRITQQPHSCLSLPRRDQERERL